MTMTINTLIEEYPESWRANDDEFYAGVRQGLRSTSKRLGLQADSGERRVIIMSAARLPFEMLNI